LIDGNACRNGHLQQAPPSPNVRTGLCRTVRVAVFFRTVAS
jgi:hypothetical protein